MADVRATSPFDFIRAVKTLEERAEQTLPLKKGDSFTASAYTEGTARLTTYFKARLPASLISFRLVAVHALLEPDLGGPANCSSGPVVVHYYVLAAAIPRSSADLPDIARSLIDKPSGAAGALSASDLLKVLPSVNYNHTRRVFAGMALHQALPLKLFDHIDVDPSVSANSTTGTAELTGSANPAVKYLNRVNWQLGTQYYDVPVGSASITKGLLSAAAFASTKELASTITLRWGVDIGGGHVQDSTRDTANSSYGEIKLLTGVAAHRANIIGTASYGLEVGKPISAATRTFEKQVFDVRFSYIHSPLPSYVTSSRKVDDDRLDYIGVRHRPLMIEAQANGGVLTGSAEVPSVERFRGGNHERPFIPGQPWDTLSQPFIRSIPENQLGVTTGSNVIGGTRFYSANLTIGKTIRGKALVPKDLADPEFLDHLDGGIATAKAELSDSYYARDPGVSGVKDSVKMLGDELIALKKKITALPPALMSLSNVKPIKSDLNQFLIGSLAAIAAINSGQVNVMPRVINTKLPGLEGELDRLSDAAKTAGDEASASLLQQSKSELDNELQHVKQIWNSLDTTGVRARSNAHAEQDFRPATTVLNRVLYTMNSYSVAPVATFDVARVWPEQHGVRYAPGAGLRLSIVNSNFTIGYAFNPVRADHEGVGAFFFKLDFTDLFR